MQFASCEVTGVSYFSLAIDRRSFLEFVTGSPLGYGLCIGRLKGVGERDKKNKGIPFSGIGGRKGQVINNNEVTYYFQQSHHPPLF